MFKKNHILTLMLLSLLWVGGCTKFLEVDPTTTYITEDNITTVKDINLILTGTYSSFTDNGIYGEAIYLLTENRSDNGYIDQTTFTQNLYRLEVMNFQESKLNRCLTNAWIHHWRGVGRANFVLKMARKFDPEARGNEALSGYMGEAYFIRALLYFNMVRIYGEIPVIRELGTSLDDAKEHVSVSLKEVYQFIIDDLNEAIKLLPVVETQVGRANQACAMALLGKIHLTMAGYPYNDTRRNPDGMAPADCYAAAWEALDPLTNHATYIARYRLLNNYNNLFDSNGKNMSVSDAVRVNKEDIISVQYLSGTGIGLGSPYAKSFAVRDYSFQIPNSGNGGCLPTIDLMNNFVYTPKRDDINNIQLADPDQPRDARGMALPAASSNSAYGLGNTITGCVRGYGGNGWYMSGKYLTVTSTSSINNDGDHNWYILRLADVILMQAEILYEQGDFQGAVDKLNVIVDRANATTGTLTTRYIMRYSLTTGDNMGKYPTDFNLLPSTINWVGRKMIQDERRRELALEGHRWFDLVRCNRFVDEAVNVNHAVDIMNYYFRYMFDNYNDGKTNLWEIKKELIQINESQLIYAIPATQIELNPQLLR